MLQWGRDLEVAERHPALLPLSRVSYASMGPRLGSRGKSNCRTARSRCVCVLQWGRDLEVAESRRCNAPLRCPKRFNGAATWKSRKVLTCSRRYSRLTGFNGAATWKSRKVQALVPLQAQRRASMGPRLGSRGKDQPIGRNRGRQRRFNGAATWKSRKGDVSGP